MNSVDRADVAAFPGLEAPEFTPGWLCYIEARGIGPDFHSEIKTSYPRSGWASWRRGDIGFPVSLCGGLHSSIRVVQIFGFFNKGGWAGVSLFFALSGFLITGILWDSYDDPHWRRNFYLRRSLRIFPLYFGSLLLVLVGAMVVGTLGQTLRMIWVPFLFLQDIPLLKKGNIDHLSSPLPPFHFWCLAVEEQFYLIWPFLLVLQPTRERAKALCLGTFCFACIYRVVLWQLASDPQPYVEFLLTRSGELAAGGWLAMSYRGAEWSRIVRFAPVASVAGLIGFLFSGFAQHTFEERGQWMLELGLARLTPFCVSLIALAIGPGIVSSLSSAGWLRWLGGISFGVYVFHVLFGKIFAGIAHVLVGTRSATAQNAAFFLIAAIGSIASAWLSFHFYETPFLRLKRRFTPTAEVQPLRDALDPQSQGV